MQKHHVVSAYTENTVLKLAYVIQALERQSFNQLSDLYSACSCNLQNPAG